MTNILHRFLKMVVASAALAHVFDQSTYTYKVSLVLGEYLPW